MMSIHVPNLWYIKNSEETRRKREEVTVQLRKEARDDKLLAKRRTAAVGAGILASPTKEGDEVTSEDKQVCNWPHFHTPWPCLVFVAWRFVTFHDSLLILMVD
jgi:acyl CoA:acetate/3-ketoacid CoA transferase alpha subunit